MPNYLGNDMEINSYVESRKEQSTLLVPFYCYIKYSRSFTYHIFINTEKEKLKHIIKNKL